nr:class I tRNA ligase family protein [Inquilinus limosus]
MGPLEAAKPWQTDGVTGIRRFLDRAWRIVCAEDDGPSPAVREVEPPPALLRLRHATVAAVTADIEALRCNTAIARLMRLARALAAANPRPRAVVEDFVLLLAPFTPHIAEELWAKLGHPDSLAHAPWPGFDPDLAAEESRDYAVQLNGKVRHHIRGPAGLDGPALIAMARADPKVVALLDGREVMREIAVSGRLVNFVTRPAG